MKHLSLIVTAVILMSSDTAFAKCHIIMFGMTEVGHQVYVNEILNSGRNLNCKILDITGDKRDVKKELQNFASKLTKDDSVSVVEIGHNDFQNRDGLATTVPFGNKRISFNELINSVQKAGHIEMQSAICGPNLNDAIVEKVLKDPSFSKTICGVTAVASSDLHMPFGNGKFDTAFTHSWRERERSGNMSLKSFQSSGLDALQSHWTFYGKRDLSDGMVLSSEYFADTVTAYPAMYCGEEAVQELELESGLLNENLMYPFFACTEVGNSLNALQDNVQDMAKIVAHLRKEWIEGTVGKSELFTLQDRMAIMGRTQDLENQLIKHAKAIRPPELDQVRNDFLKENPELAEKNDQKAHEDYQKQIIDGFMCVQSGQKQCSCSYFFQDCYYMARTLLLEKDSYLKWDESSLQNQKDTINKYFYKDGALDLGPFNEIIQQKAAAARKEDRVKAFDKFLKQKLRTGSLGIAPKIVALQRDIDIYKRFGSQIKLAHLLQPGKCPEDKRQKLIKAYKDLKACENWKPLVLDQGSWFTPAPKK